MRINCLYYGIVPHIACTPQDTHTFTTKHILNKTRIYFPQLQLLILRDTTDINTALPNGTRDTTAVQDYIRSATRLSHKNFSQTFAEHTQILIDPQEGLHDLLHQRICTVGNPDDRYQEDALRILRSIRFPIMLNQYTTGAFDFEKSTRASLCTHAHLVSSLPKERIHQELVKVCSSNNPF